MKARTSLWYPLAAAMAALVFCAIPVLAALTGDIRGLVLDSQKLPVSNAQVTVTNVATGVFRTEFTDAAGAFSSLQLDVGRYQIRVEKPGFRVYVRDNVLVRSGDAASLRISLQVGSLQETVTVESGADNYMNAASAQVATTLDPRTIEGFPVPTDPINGRDPLALAQVVPGVIPVSNDNLAFLQSGNFNVNGQRARSNNITVDNAVATDVATTQQAGLGTVPLETIQDFTMITHGFSAEFGRNSGSQVQFITKGGGNEYHGTAFWYGENSALNAKDFFSTSKPAFSQNLWGFTVGGPVIKDRLFLFGDYQGLHSNGASNTQVAAVLTPAQAAGITDPTSLALFNAVGAPQSPTGLQSNAAPNNNKQYTWSIRADETFNNSKDLFTERYSANPVTSVSPSLTFLTTTLPNYGAVGAGMNYFVNLGYTHTFTPSLVNQARFEFARTGSGFEPNTTLAAPYAPAISISGFPVMGVSVDLPQSRTQNVYQASDTLSWVKGHHALKFGGGLLYYQVNSVLDIFSRGEFLYGGVPAFQAGQPSAFLQIVGDPERDFRALDGFLFVQDDFRVTPTLTLNLGLRLESSGGVSEAHNILANLDTSSQAPLGGGGTGPLGSIDLGGTAYHRNWNWAPRLGAAWNPGGGKLVVSGGYGWSYDFLFLGPIINQQFTTPFAEQLFYPGAFMTGANSYADFAAGTAAAQVAAQSSLGTFPSNQINFGALSPVQQNLKNPMTQQWNVGLQYAITKDLVLKVTYIGSASKDLEVSVPINLVTPANRPAPAVSQADEIARYSIFANTFVQETGSAGGPATNNREDTRFNSVIQVQSVGHATYEGLQVQLLKTFSHGLSFQAAYTYGHSNDDVSDVLSVYSNDMGLGQNPLDLAANWGPSAFDIRNRFVLNTLFEVPWTRRLKGVENKVLHGWAVDGVITAQTGLPTNIFSGAVRGISDVALIGGGTELASGDPQLFQPAPSGSAAAAMIPAPCARGVNTTGTSTCTNTSNFPLTQPLLGNFGTSGRNQLRLAGVSDVDMGVYKNTSVNEKLTVQFRWETYNLFNHPNFSGFVNTLTAPNFGTYTNTAIPARTMQFAVKLLF